MRSKFYFSNKKASVEKNRLKNMDLELIIKNIANAFRVTEATVSNGDRGRMYSLIEKRERNLKNPTWLIQRNACPSSCTVSPLKDVLS
jgi:hypothetical protein